MQELNLAEIAAVAGGLFHINDEYAALVQEKDLKPAN